MKKEVRLEEATQRIRGWNRVGAWQARLWM